MCLIIAELGSGTFATCHAMWYSGMHVAVKCYHHEKIAEKHVLMEAKMLEVCAYVSLIYGPYLLVYYIIYGYIVYRTSLWHLLLSYSTVQDIPILLISLEQSTLLCLQNYRHWSCHCTQFSENPSPYTHCFMGSTTSLRATVHSFCWVRAGQHVCVYACIILH